MGCFGGFWGLFLVVWFLFGVWGRDGKELKRRYENADICLFFKKKSSKSLEVWYFVCYICATKVLHYDYGYKTKEDKNDPNRNKV